MQMEMEMQMQVQVEEIVTCHKRNSIIVRKGNPNEGALLKIYNRRQAEKAMFDT